MRLGEGGVFMANEVHVRLPAPNFQLPNFESANNVSRVSRLGLTVCLGSTSLVDDKARLPEGGLMVAFLAHITNNES